MALNVLAIVEEMVMEFPKISSELIAIEAAPDTASKITASKALIGEVMDIVVSVINGTYVVPVTPKGAPALTFNPANFAKIIAIIQAILAMLGGLTPAPVTK